ncbi:MAG: hypothetical protein HY671_13910 [Chloroflexi bacterium]|nr:hypothetical protein [Chloroflexota bacterium]
MKRLLRENLLLQFSLVSLAFMAITATVLAVSLTRISRSNVLDEATAEARDTLVQRVTGALGPEDVSLGMQGERYARFDRFVQESIVSARTARIKVWNRDGMVVYSTDKSQVGQRYPIKPALSAALKGGIAHEISEPKGVENERERTLGTLVEVYVPLRLEPSPEPVGSLEVYQYYAPFAHYINEQARLIVLGVAVGFVVLYLSLLAIVARGWRTITRQRGQLERHAQELGGLNGLLRGYLDQRQQVLNGIQQLHQSLPQMTPSPIDCTRCRGRIRNLAEKAADFPALPAE